MNQQQKVEYLLNQCNSKVEAFANANMKNTPIEEDFKKLSTSAIKSIFSNIRGGVNGFLKANKTWNEMAKDAESIHDAYSLIFCDSVSPGKEAEAFFRMIRQEKPTFSALVQKYTGKLHGSNTSFDCLNYTQQQKVMENIMESSGRKIGKLSKISKMFDGAMIVVLLIGIGVTIYKICTAENPVEETVKRVIDLGFGMAGSAIGSELGALVGACGGPVGVIIGAIIGGLAAGFLASFGSCALINVLSQAFFPATIKGHGPPNVLHCECLYGPPVLECLPLSGQPELTGKLYKGQPQLAGALVHGQPKVRGTSLKGPPKLA